MPISQKLKACALVVVLLGGMCVQAGPAPSSLPPGLDAAKGDLLVFLDRSDSKFDYTFVITKVGIFAQKATAFGSDTRWLYWVQGVPQNIEKQVMAWVEQPGDIAFPWPERYRINGPWFARIRIPGAKDAPDQAAYFGNDNKEIAAFLRFLRAATIDEKYRIEQVPEWIVQDKRLTRWTGFLGMSTDPDTFRPLTQDEEVWQNGLHSRLSRLEKQAEDRACEGKHMEAGLIFSQVAAAQEILGWRFRKDDKPWAMEEKALKEFREAGKGEAYESFLRVKYPTWVPEAVK